MKETLLKEFEKEIFMRLREEAEINERARLSLKEFEKNLSKPYISQIYDSKFLSNA